jgi:PE-PPE domain
MSQNPRPRRRVRRAATGFCAAAAVGVLCAAPALGATAFTFSGTNILSPGDRPEALLPALFAGVNVVPIGYPASILGMDRGVAVGLSNLAAAMAGVEGPIVISGFSQGAIAVAAEKAHLMALAPDERPAADELTFITVGDPTGPNGILHWLPGRVPFIGVSPVDVPDTPYDSVVVNRQYDGWADLPDRPLNLLADANAVLGIIYVHGRYDQADLDLSHVPAKNVTETTNSAGGKTTTYLVPTKRLPLLQPLRDLGIPEQIVARIEHPLRRIVDLGYSRNDAKPATTKPADATKPAADAKPERKHPRVRSSVRATPGIEAAHGGKPRHTATRPRHDAEPSNSAPESHANESTGDAA